MTYGTMLPVELDEFGTFPHPWGPPNHLSSPILYLVPSPGTYHDTHHSYLHFLELSGGCTGHYLEKGSIAYCILQDKNYGGYISDLSIVAGEIDLLVRSQIPTEERPKSVQVLAERAENALNEWLRRKEVQDVKYRAVNIGLCHLENNPIRVEIVGYDWGVSCNDKGEDKESYCLLGLDLGEEANNKWFLDEKSRSNIRDLLLRDKAFSETQFHEKVSSGNLHPIYIPPLYFGSLLIHFWIEFRDSTFDDLMRAIDNPDGSVMSTQLYKVRDFLFRVLKVKDEEAFMSFLVPDLVSLYKVLDSTHQIHNFHRIRSRVVTHSFLLRPPFLTEIEGNEY